MILPAHIRIGEDGTKIVQSVGEHSRNASKVASICVQDAGLYYVAKLAALLHDMGKCKHRFAQKLELGMLQPGSAYRRVIHTYTGAKFCLERWHRPIAGSSGNQSIRNLTAEIIAYAVSAHHAQMDCVDEYKRSGFARRLEGDSEYDEAASNYLNHCVPVDELDYLFERAAVEIRTLVERLFAIAPRNQDGLTEAHYYTGLIARMVASAVIEGDRLDTASFADGTPLNVRRASKAEVSDFWAASYASMEAYIGTLPTGTAIQQARRAVSDQCYAASKGQPGVYKLQLPVGAGATTSLIRYAVAHASRWAKSRIVYVGGTQAAVEQAAELMSKFVASCNISARPGEIGRVPTDADQRQLDKLALLSERWDTPVIAVTLPQLLDWVIGTDPIAMRRLWLLSDSVLIVDDAQTIPLHMRSIVNLTINYLASVGGTTVVLNSPALTSTSYDTMTQHIRGVVEESDRHPVRVPCVPLISNVSDVLGSRTVLRQVHHGRLEDLPAVAQKIIRDVSSMLIVCNTRRQAQELYRTMSESGDSDGITVLHYSGSMCYVHRIAQLDALKNALGKGRKVVMVASPSIEGVDLSFGAVLRLSSSLDHILRAGGLCNRDGEHGSQCPVYLYHCDGENLSWLPDIQRGKTTMEHLLSLLDALDPVVDAQAINLYYQLDHRELAVGAQDGTIRRKGISVSLLGLLADNPFAVGAYQSKGMYQLNQAFKLAGSLFRGYGRAETVDLIVPWTRRGASLIDAIADLDLTSTAPGEIINALRESVPYGITVYRSQFEALKRKHALIPLLDGAVWALSPDWYDPDTGLELSKI